MGRRLIGAVTALLVLQLLAAGTAEARSRDQRRGDDRRFDRRGRVEFRGRDVQIDRSSRSYYMRRNNDGRADFGYGNRRHGDFDRDTRGFVRSHDVVVVDRYRDRQRYVNTYPVYGAPRPIYVERPVYVQRPVYPVYVEPRPVYVVPRPVVYVPTPVVVYPHPATIVTGPQFILTGRAPIGSRIMVEVTAIFGGQSVYYPATYDSYVDYHGGFQVPIHTGYPGAQHRIKVWSVMNGVYSAPAGLVVYRR
jgi:hypothetical protein